MVLVPRQCKAWGRVCRVAMSKKALPVASRELDTGHATRGVWLVKVPKYLSEAWMAAGASTDVGVMRVNS